MVVWYLRISRWIREATNSHSEYVVLIAFTLQLWLHESVLMLHYTYIACLVNRLIIITHLI
jgi:hypothetical protein